MNLLSTELSKISYRQLSSKMSKSDVKMEHSCMKKETVQNYKKQIVVNLGQCLKKTEKLTLFPLTFPQQLSRQIIAEGLLC